MLFPAWAGVIRAAQPPARDADPFPRGCGGAPERTEDLYFNLSLKSNVQRHYEVIRRYVQKTDRSLYSYGWLLDISRCIYTLRTGRIIPKTAAGEWALRESLCPCRDDLAKAVMIRREPGRYLNGESVFNYAETLGDNVQRYADVLEIELNR